MRIAVTYENGNIFPHFGHTKQFKLYDIENGTLVHEQTVDTNGSGHSALAGFLSDLGVDVLICGGIGDGAKAALQEAGIRLFGGVTGKADSAVADFTEGKLDFNPNIQCRHHNHGEKSCDKHDSCHNKSKGV